MRIIIGAGGSGGHVFPALETAKKLKAQDHKVIFLTTKGLAFDLVCADGFEAWIIDPPRVKFSSPISALKEVWGMMRTIFDAFVLIGHLSANAVVGFGGYGAFPVVLAGVFRRLPTLIHEQNVVPSRSNRVLSRLVSRIAISFEQSGKYFPSKKVVLSGCPCRNTPPRRSKRELYQEFGFSPEKKTIFVLGGSQGSRRINEEFVKAVRLLKGSFDFQVVHLCGKSDYENLKKEYDALCVPCRLFEFLDDVQSAYTIADLVIARSGAVTVCEILSFKKRSILIPYPLIRVHQKENALVVVEKGLGVIVENKECTASRLNKEIMNIFNASRPQTPVFLKEEQKSDWPQEKIAYEILRLA